MKVFDDFLPWNKERTELVSAENWETLRQPATNVVQDQAITITNLMVLLFTKVQGTPRLDTYKARNHVVNWFEQVGRYSYSVDYLYSLLDGFTPDSEQRKALGINLVGYGYSTTGLGEDIRNLAHTLKTLKIPYCLVPIGHPSDSPAYISKEVVSPYPKYTHTIFCMNLLEFVRFCEAYTNVKSIFGKIALQAPWELPELPKIQDECLGFVDSFWCISDFNKTAYQTSGIDAVQRVPLVFKTRPATSCKMSACRNGPFTFLYMFDSRSYVRRKNPQALIDAFQLAFQNGENVRLVIKTSTSNEHSDFQDMHRRCAGDERIHLICEQYNEHEVSDLLQSSDCYVSLHRSEGFGRTLIEAALCHKPVISTGWSGSLDAFPQDWPLLVAFDLVDVKDHEYPHSSGQVWADVSVSDAAKKMRAVYLMPEDEKNKLTHWHYSWANNRFVLPEVTRSYEVILSEFLSEELRNV